jgi:galactokinase
VGEPNESLQRTFREAYGRDPERLAWAPGRVNLIGEHIDYSGGRVLPMAIERGTGVAIARNATDWVRARSANEPGELRVNVGDRTANTAVSWTNYIAGVLEELCNSDQSVPGVDILILGDLPLGSGLSSSASLTVAVTTAFEAMLGRRMCDIDAAHLAQRVEHDHVGVHSGIMDPFVSRAARAGHALLLDCATLKTEYVPVIIESAAFVITNTRKPRTLASSKYNERVLECRSVVEALNAHLARRESHLCRFSRDDVESAREVLGDGLYRRARHAVTEAARVERAAKALRIGDVDTFSLLLRQSHDSLVDDYEVSCPEIDAMYRAAEEAPGWLGGRLTGAGFGGCLIHLVERTQAEAFIERTLARYVDATGIAGDAFVTSAAPGASVTAFSDTR